MGGACLENSDCTEGLFCDTLNRGSKIGVAVYVGNRTTASDYGQCADHFAPYTKCNLSMGSCESPYSCELASGNDHYCVRTNETAGTQFNSWVKVGGIDFALSTATYHSGASSALVGGSGSNTSYAYNSALLGSLEGDAKYMLEFWAQTSTAGSLARYALYDTINNAYLNDSGQWIYASSGNAPSGSTITPLTSTSGSWKHVVKAFRTLQNAKIQLRFYPLPEVSYYVDDLAVTQANDFSMLAWVRAGSPQPGGMLFSQMGTAEGSPQGINWSINPSNTLTMGMHSSGEQGVHDGAAASLLPTISLADGKWHQVALSADRTGNYSVYLDGALYSQALFTLGSLENNGTFYLGSPLSGGFKGELGEVRFYKRALTPADVLDHYNGWFQQQCKISLAFSYSGAAAQNLTAAYNADLRIRKLLPETILAMPFDVNVSSDGRGMIVDYSRFLGAGTKTGAAWTADGKVGGAYAFDGSGKIALPSALLTGTGDFTAAAWIRPSSLGTSCVLCSNLTTGFTLGYNSGLSVSAGPSSLAYPFTPAGGAWVHIAAVRKAGIGYLYVNGTLAAQGALPGSIASAEPLTIGSSPSGTSGFVGAIDEVRVFSRALTDAEILSLYNDNALASSAALPLSQN
jgi:hypothetical protein